MDAEKWERTALRTADVVRLVPVIALLCYGVACAVIAAWYMAQPDESANGGRAWFVSAVFMVAPLVVGVLTPCLQGWDERARQIRERLQR